jgi:hypothetical protein
MKKQDWKSVGELIGVVAIVASLIFVGLQLKQAQEIAIADQYQNRADAALEFYLALLQTDRALELFANGIETQIEAGTATPEMVNAFEDEGGKLLATRYLIYRSNMTAFDNYYFQYEQGFMTEDAWQPFRQRLKNLLSSELRASFYEQMRLDVRATFRTLCDEILAELRADAANT